MQLSVMSEEMLNSAMFEDDAVNSDSNADSAAAAAEEVVLQLTVDDDPQYNSSSLISAVSADSVLAKSDTCLTKCRRNLPSSLSEKMSSGRTHAEVFRQYLLDGDIQTRILELDNASMQKGKTTIWDKLAKKVYGKFSHQLHRRMFTAWRRKRVGSVRDKVLYSLQAEGLLTYSNSISVSSEPSEAHCEVDNYRATSVENHTEAHCYHAVNLADVVRSHWHNIPGEDKKSKLVDNCGTVGNYRSIIVTRNRHQNNSNVICIRRPSTVFSYSLKVTKRQQPMSRHRNNSMSSSVKRQQKYQHPQSFGRPVNTIRKSCSSPSLMQQMSEDTSDLELDDVDIQKAMDILKAHCPNVAGLEHVGLGTCIRGRSVPRFAAAGNRRFVQIVNVGDHWVCATNVFGGTTCDVYVYDSLFSRVMPSLVVQMSSILRLDNTSSSITFHIREFKQQKPGTRWCGYYAVAAAFAVCHGTDPTGTVYTMEQLHEAVKQHLDAGSFGLLPATNCKLKRDVQTLTKQRLFCVCHKRAMGQMLLCERCHNQFHASCIAAFQLPLTSGSQLQRGPCCAHVTDSL